MQKAINPIFQSLGCGRLSVEPCVFMADGSRITPHYHCTVNQKGSTATLCAEQADLFRDMLVFNFDDEKILCRRVFESLAQEEIRVKELGFMLRGIDFDRAKDDDYFYHIENARVFGNMTFPVDYNRMDIDDPANAKFGIVPGDRWPDMGKIDEPLPERIGSSLFQPFPAILVSNYQVKKGLVHGTLSQNVFYHNYNVCHEDDTVTLEIYSSFMDIDALTMEPGRILVDEWYLGTTDEADDLEKIFTGYTAELRKKLPIMYGRSNANRKSVAWGSWNDGLWRNISEDIIVAEAEYIKENFPTCQWIQVDDGYAIHNMCLSLGMPYSGEEELDKNKFPNGMRHYTDRLRQIGVRPALWMGGKCPHKSKIYQEHPEWFLDYSHIFSDASPLDVSRADVREYMEKAIKKLFVEYGFDSIKLDFWSHPFEDRFPLLSDTHKSGYELRHWWLQTIRNVLPQDGYLQTGCDIAMGNPFLGEFATNYRYGIDISGGNWVNVKLTLLWGVNCFATHTGDMFVPNSDSVGLFPGLTETEAMFCINYCLVTHSMVELAGQLSKSDDTHRLKTLKKAICNPNNGQDVYFVNYDYRAKKTKSLPDAMYFKTPHFSCVEGNSAMPIVTFGLFNVEDEARSITVSPTDMGLAAGSYVFTNVWTGEQQTTDTLTDTVEPHGSALYAVSRTDGVQLYDANIRINALHMQDDVMTLETDYKSKDTELLLSAQPKKIMLEGRDIPFTLQDKTVVFDTDAAGRLTLLFS